MADEVGDCGFESFDTAMGATLDLTIGQEREEPLDLVASPIQIRTEADRTVAIALGRDGCPCAFLHGKLPDPIGVVAAVGKQRRSGLQPRQKFAGIPIIVSLTGAQRQSYRKASAVHECMDLAGQSAS